MPLPFPALFYATAVCFHCFSVLKLCPGHVASTGSSPQCSTRPAKHPGFCDCLKLQLGNPIVWSNLHNRVGENVNTD